MTWPTEQRKKHQSYLLSLSHPCIAIIYPSEALSKVDCVSIGIAFGYLLYMGRLKYPQEENRACTVNISSLCTRLLLLTEQ